MSRRGWLSISYSKDDGMRLLTGSNGVTGPYIGVCIVVQQSHHNLASFLGRLVQSRLSTIIFCTDVRIVVQQQPRHGVVPFPGCPVQRCTSFYSALTSTFLCASNCCTIVSKPR